MDPQIHFTSAPTYWHVLQEPWLLYLPKYFLKHTYCCDCVNIKHVIHIERASRGVNSKKVHTDRPVDISHGMLCTQTLTLECTNWQRQNPVDKPEHAHSGAGKLKAKGFMQTNQIFSSFPEFCARVGNCLHCSYGSWHQHLVIILREQIEPRVLSAVRTVRIVRWTGEDGVKMSTPLRCHPLHLPHLMFCQR